MEYIRGGLMPNLKIFTIMDVDGDGRSKNSYITGEMFRNCPLGKHVIPIINDTNLEVVMEAIRYPKVTDKISSYTNMVIEPNDFLSRLKKCDRTNMELLVEQMMRSCPSYQGRF